MEALFELIEDQTEIKKFSSEKDWSNNNRQEVP
jgi:hypothetical protein